MIFKNNWFFYLIGIMNFIKPPNYDNTKYKVCEIHNTHGACLSNAECTNAGGKFAGYCDGQDVCCVGE